MNRVVDFSAIWTLSEMGWHWFWIETSNLDILELLARLAMPTAETSRMNETGAVLSDLWLVLAS